LQSIKSIFETQDELNNLDNADVATYLQENHNLTLNPNAEKVDKQTLKEVEINGLTSVPTVIVNGTQYIDDQLAPIDELLKKG
jgi:protein-disulfide isomerase